MQASQSRSRFGDQLRAQLDAHSSIKSVRRLAFAMAASPEKVENARRMLQKWIAADGAKPTPESRAEVAAALGVDASVFADPDEDEEDLLRLLRAEVRAKAVSPGLDDVLLVAVLRMRQKRRETGDPWAVSK